MLLKNVKDIHDLDIIYSEHKLFKAKDKILFLKNEMGIITSRGDVESVEEELKGLEELALSHMWEGLKG